MTLSTSTMTTRTGLAAASVAVLLGVTACSGGDADAYCDTLEASAQELAALDDASNPNAFEEAIDGLVAMMHDAESDAPEEVAEEHAAVQSAFEDLQEMDFAQLMDVESLMSMDEEEQAELEAEFAEMEERFADMDEYGERWGEWVEENCEVSEVL